ncbi:competence/damage-inducible protein A [Candidatus Bathyarchaeota archaeon]|nr:MAG: competence/damage-inducible protein A [Candidatus Bathyarchaeota archaeon]
MSPLDVGILIVGNEILDGVVLDTNSNWLVRRLRALALHIREFMTVRDEVPEIAKALRRMVEDGCDLIITTGGLGPTHDDKTLRGVAAAFNLPLELNKEALGIVERQYRTFYERGVIRTSEITEARRKMALLPRGARPLDNRVGSAPGVLLEMSEATIICLPGVPAELKWIFENEVLGILKERVKGLMRERILSLPAGDESTLSPIIDEVMAQVPGVYIKSMVQPYAGKGHIRLWISAYGDTEDEVEGRISRAVEKLMRKLREGTQ